MNGKALNLLGLMRRANALQVGEQDTGIAARAQTAKLIIVAKDASDNALKRAKGYVIGRPTQLVVLPFTKEEISGAVGKSGCSMAAVCDLGFANAFLEILCEISPEEYSQAKLLIGERLERENRRKSELKAHERNKRIGKRRNNA